MRRRLLSLLAGAAAVVTAAVVTACGEPTVTASNESFEPRIVVEGVLMPGYPVDRIRVTRNVRVTARLDQTDLSIPGALVTLTEESSGRRFDLTLQEGPFDIVRHYGYDGDDLVIRHGERYTLEVTGQLEGRQLTTRATTTVPEAGFEIASISHDSLPYRPEGPDGEVVDVQMRLQRSPGTPLYLMTVRALNASPESFVYDNPFTDEDPDDLDLLDFGYEWEWLQNPPQTAGLSTMNVFWWDLWFYSRYEIVVFAADVNYARFIQTFEDVQEEDGNFHEPIFSMQGDGIGYFGSAVPDTVYLEVTR
jgi:hypothetical protein